MPRILIVEDEPAIAELVALNLRHSGYETQCVGSSADADLVVRTALPDLVVLDWMLPGESGVALARRWRANARTRNLPIVMLTARSQEADLVQGLDAGADDYLAKPFSMLELVARIRALFRRIEQLSAPAAAAQELRFGPFRLDTVRRELLRGNEPVPLTLREFDLLHFLLKHPARPFSRSELLQRVWGDGFDGYEHTVNSHINRLRSRIEDDPREPRRVVTVWGVGYRFDPEPTVTRP